MWKLLSGFMKSLDSRVTLVLEPKNRSILDVILSILDVKGYKIIVREWTGFHFLERAGVYEFHRKAKQLLAVFSRLGGS
jgi:hypothetical protein